MNIIKNLKFTYVLLLLVMLSSCGKKGGVLGASGDMDSYENSDVDAIEQALPTIMILPSDNLLERYGALERKQLDGRPFVLRDYEKYLLTNEDNKSIISAIQDAFVQEGYPLQDLEQLLKQLSTQEAVDISDNLDKDSKTLLLTTASPDIVLELDYRTTMSMTSHDLKSSNANITLNALDPYTSKVISSTTMEKVNGSSLREIVRNGLEESMSKLKGDLGNYFSDILTKGREITVRISVEDGGNVNLSNLSVEGDTYADWIIDYMKANTIKGAYKLQRNTNKELYFVNCRIKLLSEDGTQYSVYDWTREFCKNLYKNLGLNTQNKAQGLGEVLITVNGI